MMGQAEYHGGHTEEGDPREHRNSDPPGDRPEGQPQRAQARSNPRRRPQIPEYIGTGVQDVLRECRQQGGRATEQYRKKIQRNGPQYRFSVPHEAQPLQHAAP
jgi:ribosome-binding protein aMBF1 (putative translation factor)